MIHKAIGGNQKYVHPNIHVHFGSTTCSMQSKPTCGLFSMKIHNNLRCTISETGVFQRVTKRQPRIAQMMRKRQMGRTATQILPHSVNSGRKILSNHRNLQEVPKPYSLRSLQLQPCKSNPTSTTHFFYKRYLCLRHK